MREGGREGGREWMEGWREGRRKGGKEGGNYNWNVKDKTLHREKAIGKVRQQLLSMEN